MKITPQDIIDREFRVKFRGFDMAEVDTFLEEVAENFFKLTEENTLLNEKILALNKDLENAGGAPSMSQAEIPAELTGILEDLKQDIETMRSELVAHKQDRQDFGALEKNLQTAVDSIKQAADGLQSQGQQELPADLGKSFDEFKQGNEAIAAELAAFKEDRGVLEALGTKLQQAVESAGKAASSMPGEGRAELPADLGKTLDEFKKGTESIAAELKNFKEEIGSIQKIREEIKNELQDMLTSHFKEFGAKLAEMRPAAEPAAPKTKAAAKPKKKEVLPTAEIAEESEEDEDSRLPDYVYDDDSDAGDLEFLSEDDIMDVDKLRGVFQSVLDDSVSNGHNTREGEDDDSTADLLFLDDDDELFEDQHEPEVTFSLDDNEPESKPKSKHT